MDDWQFDYPSERGWYLVTIPLAGGRAVIQAYFQGVDSKPQWLRGDQIKFAAWPFLHEYGHYLEVLAWRPLPAPLEF